jgi:hypothetical protein
MSFTEFYAQESFEVKQTATEFTNFKQIRKLILARSGGEWLASRSGHFNSEEKASIGIL